MTAARAISLAALLFAAPALGQVVDGDTLDWNGHRWRIAAIDTPERGEPFYRVAKDRLQALTRDGVGCRDTGEKPSHGRLIGVCSAGGADVALILVTEGLAAACHNRPLSRPYIDAEKAAQDGRRGIWAELGYRRKGYCKGG